MNNNKESFLRKNGLTLIILVIALGLLFFQNNNHNLDYIERELFLKDSLIEVSKLRQDSLDLVISDGKVEASDWEAKWKESELRNKRKNEKIKKLEKTLSTPDTVFISNARRISESSNRFYESNDSIR